MQFRPDWRRVAVHAWSIRWTLAAGVLAGCEMALPIIDQVFDIPRGIFATASGLATCGSVIARLLAQASLPIPPSTAAAPTSSGADFGSVSSDHSCADGSSCSH